MEEVFFGMAGGGEEDNPGVDTGWGCCFPKPHRRLLRLSRPYKIHPLHMTRQRPARRRADSRPAHRLRPLCRPVGQLRSLLKKPANRVLAAKKNPVARRHSGKGQGSKQHQRLTRYLPALRGEDAAEVGIGSEVAGDEGAGHGAKIEGLRNLPLRRSSRPAKAKNRCTKNKAQGTGRLGKKTPALMLKHLLLSCLLLLAATAFSQKNAPAKSHKAADTLDLAEALAQKIVSAKVASTGGYSGASLKITLQSLQKQVCRVRVPLGQYLMPADTLAQRLVVAESQTALVGLRAVELTLTTFCTQAGHTSPMNNMVFAVGAQAPEQLRQLLQHLVETGKTSSSWAQNAVWCITDRHPVANIEAPAMGLFVAKLLGVEPPKYRIRRQPVRQAPGLPANVGKALLVEGSFTYYLHRQELLSLRLYDAADKVVQVVFQDRKTADGEHEATLRLKMHDLPAGKYFVRLEAKDGALVKEMAVEI